MVVVKSIQKLHEGGPSINDYIKKREVDLIINTPVGKASHHDDRYIRLNAMKAGISCVTTLSAARALIEAIRAIKSERLTVNALQDYKLND